MSATSECPVSGDYCRDGVVDGEIHGWWYCSCDRGRERQAEEAMRKNPWVGFPPSAAAVVRRPDYSLLNWWLRGCPRDAFPAYPPTEPAGYVVCHPAAAFLPEKLWITDPRVRR